MLERYHEERLAEPIAVVFAALVRALARERWASVAALEDISPLPRSGFRYSVRQHGRWRHGQVIECLRPVSIVLLETLQRSPSCVRVRQRWRVQPLPSETRLSCDLKAHLNRIANLKRRRWIRRFDVELCRIVAAVRIDLDREAQRASAGTIGQSNGSTAIVSTNARTVNGWPTVR